MRFKTGQGDQEKKIKCLAEGFKICPKCEKTKIRIDRVMCATCKRAKAKENSDRRRFPRQRDNPTLTRLMNAFINNREILDNEIMGTRDF